MYARRLRCGTTRNPNPHRVCISTSTTPLLIYGHVYAVRDHPKELARRALHRKHVPFRPGRGRGLATATAARRLEHGERVAAVRAQRTTGHAVHVVKLGAPALAADHVFKRARYVPVPVPVPPVAAIGVRAPALECLRERSRARGRRSVHQGPHEGDVGRGRQGAGAVGGRVRICGGGGGDVP
jgi:hypothetical protein